MGKIVEFTGSEAELSAMTLDQLFEQAAEYGSVHVYSSDDKKHPNRYCVTIRFESVPGTSVEAKSNFGRQIHDAFIQAITRAQQIAAQYK